MKLCVVAAPAAAAPLEERLALLSEAAEAEVIVGRAAGDFAKVARKAREGWLPYLVDVNMTTLRAATGLRSRGIRYVLDTGDDPGSLAIGMGLSRRASGMRRSAERLMLTAAAGVVYRGHYHRLLLESRTRAPRSWIPDTAPDWLYDVEWARGESLTLGTFGTTRLPASPSERIYGQEVVEALLYNPDLTSILVGRGAGLGVLQGRAHDLGVTERVRFSSALPTRDLLMLMSQAQWLTSIQSDDIAGWVRTTGKLPLALATGRCLISSNVGEAARILPRELLLPGERAPGEEVANIATQGMPADWPSTARTLAKAYKRSTVAGRLAEFLESL